MLEELTKFFSIMLLTMLKFIAGPTLGYAAGFNLIETILVTICGMMASVTLFAYLGTFIRKRIFSYIFKARRTFSKRNRKFVTIWRKYGVIGVALLTPLVLTPIGGTILLTSFRTPRSLIMSYMLISAVIWSIIMSGAIYLLGDQLLRWLPTD